MHETIPLPYNKDNIIVTLSFIKGGITYEFLGTNGEDHRCRRRKKKKEELYQKTFHELAEKLSEIRNKETQDEAED